MKKIIILSICAILVLSGCGSYTGMGAYTGSNIGAVLGSAIGGITGGPRGHDYGTIIGMAGGAIIGGAIGAKADQDRQDSYAAAREEMRARRRAQADSGYERRGNNDSYDYDNRRYDSNGNDNYGGFDSTNSGDDRLFDFDTDNTSSYVDVTESDASEVIISNLRYVNSENDAFLRSNQVSKIVFEVRNNTRHTLYNLQPVVESIADSKRIWISPSAFIENLAPGRAVRYTAMVSTGKLKEGQAAFNVFVQHNGKVVSDARKFTLNTQK